MTNEHHAISDIFVSKTFFFTQALCTLLLALYMYMHSADHYSELRNNYPSCTENLIVIVTDIVSGQETPISFMHKNWTLLN